MNPNKNHYQPKLEREEYYAKAENNSYRKL